MEALVNVSPLIRHTGPHYDYHNLLASYLRNEIEAEEFDAGLDILIARDPNAIGSVGDPLPTSIEDEVFAPGHIQRVQVVPMGHR